MSRYKFIKERDENNTFDITEITFNVEAVQLEDLIQEFELFLKASGFIFDGNLEILNLEVDTND
jgi:hypothetical protein